MPDKNLEVCPVCGVKIEGGDKVLFSTGSPGTRARLWARVCNYAKKPDCINQNTDVIGPIGGNDHYQPI